MKPLSPIFHHLSCLPCFLTIFLFLVLSGASAQELSIDQVMSKKNFYVISRVNKGEVVLRWAPTSADLWENTNSVGYHIDRLKVPDNMNQSPPTFERLTATPIQPWPSANWEALVEEDDNAAIAYMTIYGERPADEGGLYLQMRKNDELKGKSYFFAMTAASQSAKAAEAMGLSFIDKDITAATRYIYRVYAAAPLPNQPLDTAMVMVNTDEYTVQLPPQGLSTVSLEKQVVIKWPTAINRIQFSAYHLERSSNANGPFTRLNDAPILQLNSDAVPSFNEHFKRIDSVGQNYQPHYYRIIGITQFGEQSPPSEAVLGMGRDFTPPTSPVLEEIETKDNARVELAWNKHHFEPDFAGFIVGRSALAEGPFTPLHDQLLPRVVSTFTDDRPNPAGLNYYQITAVDTAGNASQSFARYALFLDTFPPAAPLGLTGAVDSNGRVNLSWDPNTELDLKGYRVYFANAADHPFIQISPTLLTETRYEDSITLNTLTEEIFYRVVAVDQGLGHSPYSEFIRLERPDIIPPSSGVFNRYSVNKDNTVLLEWTPSSSHDLAGQQLYRKESGTTKLIATFDASTSRFQDTALQNGATYEYTLQAIDDDGLQSPHSISLDVSITEVTQETPVSRLTAFYNKEKGYTEIAWAYADELMQNRRFVIYRAIPGSELRSYESVQGATSFRDFQADRAGEFSYAIMVVSPKGKSTMSSLVNVNVPD